MAKASDFKITFEIEPVVKLVCQNIGCIYNLLSNVNGRDSAPACNLKHVVINDAGHCSEEISVRASDDYGGMNTVLDEAGFLPIDEDFDPMKEPGTIKR